MKKISVIGATLVGAALLLATPVSLHQSRDTGLSLSVDKAQAVIGRPLSARERCWCSPEGPQACVSAWIPLLNFRQRIGCAVTLTTPSAASVSPPPVRVVYRHRCALALVGNGSEAHPA